MENEQNVIDALNAEIKEELATTNLLVSEEEQSSAELKQSISDKATTRKPFRITEFDTPKDKEMAVFTHAKKLSEYIFVITEKSPVKFRWNILSRLLNTSVDIIESLYRANYEKGDDRLVWQKKAMIALNLLDFYAETAKTKQAITFKQMTIIARQISEVKKMLSGWVRTTKQKKCWEKILHIIHFLWK